MIKALKIAFAFLLLWSVFSTCIFVYSDLLSWHPEPYGDISINVLPTSSDWTVPSAALPITSSSGSSSYGDGDDPLSILEPIQVLRQYQKEHSTLALQQEQDALAFNVDDATRIHIATDRKFLVAYYYGPHRAGNILHNFFNSIIWAIITNRTVLWEYYVDRPNSNTVDDCEQYLQRHNWLPSYKEWSRKLQLDAPVPVRARDMLSASAQVVVAPQIRDLFPKNGMIQRVKWSDDPAHLLQQTPPWTRVLQEWLLSLSSSSSDVVQQERFRRLYSRGLVFLYGMLFQECFTITGVNTTTTSITASADGRPIGPKPTDISIALHSRHTVAADDGSYVNHEIACLQKLLLPAVVHASKEVSTSKSTPWCRVFLMSDRPKTLELLSAWLLARNCTPVVSSDISVGNSDISDTSINIDTATSTPQQPPADEHGPRAGAGFLEDLIMASAARTGFIGVESRQQGLPARSSTALVLEKIEYDRTVEAVLALTRHSSGTSSTRRYHPLGQLNALQRCSMPLGDETKGYTYGPGTPLFRRNETWIQQVHLERRNDRRLRALGSDCTQPDSGC
jgi:hypothetical protein